MSAYHHPEEVSRVISYLPPNHIGSEIMDIHWAISVARSVYFAQPDALKGSIEQTLREVKPTLFFGPPR